MSHPDYDTLVAAHLLRSPDFAARFGPLIIKTEGRFFEEFWTRDTVLHSLGVFHGTGRLLPPQSLKADVRLFGRNGTSQDNYDMEIDRIWQVPDSVLTTSRLHVEQRLTEEVQARLLLQEDLHEMCSVGSLEGLWKVLDAIRVLGVEKDGVARRLGTGLLDTLQDPPVGIPIGLPPLEQALPSGGPTAGETVLFYGRYAIGKSILLNHAVRSSAMAKRVSLLWAVGDGSQKTLELRLAKGFLGWTDQQLRADPVAAHRAFLDRFGDLPLYALWSPPSRTGRAQIMAQLDRIENDCGRKVQLLAMDYSEKRAQGRDWNQVCDAYAELREICGERGMVGLDVAQENSSGTISYFNLLKDADIGIQLTPMHPAEWRRRQRSHKENDTKEVSIPTRGAVYGEIVRAREGASGTVFELWVDRETGTVRPRERGGEEE